MKLYDVTVWPEDERKPYSTRIEAPTSIDALLRVLATVRDGGVTSARVRLVTTDERMVDAMHGPKVTT